MSELINEEYDKAYSLAVTGLKKVDDEISLGQLSLDQRTTIMDTIAHEEVTRQDKALAYEQIAAITEDDFFLKAARRMFVGRAQSGPSNIAISTRRF